MFFLSSLSLHLHQIYFTFHEREIQEREKENGALSSSSSSWFPSRTAATSLFLSAFQIWVFQKEKKRLQICWKWSWKVCIIPCRLIISLDLVRRRPNVAGERKIYRFRLRSGFHGSETTRRLGSWVSCSWFRSRSCGGFVGFLFMVQKVSGQAPWLVGRSPVKLRRSSVPKLLSHMNLQSIPKSFFPKSFLQSILICEMLLLDRDGEKKELIKFRGCVNFSPSICFHTLNKFISLYPL